MSGITTNTNSVSADPGYFNQTNNAPFSFSLIAEKLQGLTTELSKLQKDARIEENRVSQIHREKAKENSLKAASQTKLAAVVEGTIGGLGGVVGMGGYLTKGFSAAKNRLTDGGLVDFNKAETRQLRHFFKKNPKAAEELMEMSNAGKFNSVGDFTGKYANFPLKTMSQTKFESSLATIAERAQAAVLSSTITQSASAFGTAVPGIGRAASSAPAEQASMATSSSEREKEMQRHDEKQRDESDQTTKSLIAEHRQSLNAIAQAIAQTINSVPGKF